MVKIQSKTVKIGPEIKTEWCQNAFQWKRSQNATYKKSIELSLILVFQVQKHKVDGVRRLAAHSHLPLCKFLTLQNVFICIFLVYLSVRCHRLSRRFDQVMGMVPHAASSERPTFRSFCQGEQSQVQPSRQQIRRLWRRRKCGTLASGKCICPFLCKLINVY